MRNLLIIICVLTLLGAGCATQNMQKVSFNTSDGAKIVGNWSAVAGSSNAVLLLHMRPAAKESWQDMEK